MSPLQDYRLKVKNEKRAAALEAAVRLFLEQGYDRTTLQQIAKEAEISTGTLFNHFPTKAEIFGSLMQVFYENDSDFEHEILPAGDPRKALTIIGHDYARILRRPLTAPLYRLMIAESPRFPELGRALFEKGKDPYLQRLHEYMRSEISLGTLAVNDIPLASRQFLGMINDIIFWPEMLLAGAAVTDEAGIDFVICEAVMTFLSRYQKSPRAGK